MIGDLIGAAIGIFAIILGSKGFSKDGIPFTRDKKITGITAKIIGAVVIAFGVLVILAIASVRIMHEMMLMRQ